MLTQKRSGPSAKTLAKGQAALALWRKNKAIAEKKGGAFLVAWEQSEFERKSKQKLTPMKAIKLFCNNCVGTRIDITNCTATKCPLYTFRPYQKGSKDDE